MSDRKMNMDRDLVLTAPEAICQILESYRKSGIRRDSTMSELMAALGAAYAAALRLRVEWRAMGALEDGVEDAVE